MTHTIHHNLFNLVLLVAKHLGMPKQIGLPLGMHSLLEVVDTHIGHDNIPVRIAARNDAHVVDNKPVRSPTVYELHLGMHVIPIWLLDTQLPIVRLDMDAPCVGHPDEDVYISELDDQALAVQLKKLEESSVPVVTLSVRVQWMIWAAPNLIKNLAGEAVALLEKMAAGNPLYFSGSHDGQQVSFGHACPFIHTWKWDTIIAHILLAKQRGSAVETHQDSRYPYETLVWDDIHTAALGRHIIGHNGRLRRGQMWGTSWAFSGRGDSLTLTSINVRGETLVTRLTIAEFLLHSRESSFEYIQKTIEFPDGLIEQQRNYVTYESEQYYTTGFQERMAQIKVLCCTLAQDVISNGLPPRYMFD